MRDSMQWKIAVAIAAITLASGCSNNTADDAEPTEQTDSPDSEGQQVDLPHSGAPPIDDPVQDIARFEEEPCSILGDDELAESGFPINHAEADLEASTGPRCEFEMKSSEGTRAGVFAVTLTAPDSEGLSHIYRLEESGTLELFEELDYIEGYPAVIAGQRDERHRGECDIYTGVRDANALMLQVTATSDTSPHHETPCESARELTTLAIQNLTGGV
ncbi:DUF3558 domain-containing protein [Haloechinothrix sp. YIM 98757]|uniref:DUF3558 domain-containing protein n=1 Tax=Haloechinothrix aidingensis TaxID=2752311 RepID=A0A838AEN1_9PSEU|nr:DUF3558 domain-containing protein [Haloechinothrix aidingensis]MBA0127605.1 DUF3558 domain-containing protein [Haloechinothrix aidingensis]